MTRISDISELTPIDKYHGIYFKRDDLYLPFEGSELGGGKTRQMQALISCIKAKSDKIEGLITNPVTLSSPQSAIVAKVAKDNNVPCMICIGGNILSIEKTVKKYKPLKLAFELGAVINVVAMIGYSNVISSRVRDIVQENNYHVIDFGINLTDYPDAILGSTANQVINLPDNLDNLIVPCGSALTFAGIIVGIEKYKKKVKRIIGIQISGFDRRKKIDLVLNKFGIERKYEFYIDRTYPYSKNIENYVSSDFDLNVKYESKAFQYFCRNRKQLNISDADQTLVWVIGNNNFLFD